MRFLFITWVSVVAGVTALATDFYPEKVAISNIQKLLQTKNLEIKGIHNFSADLDTRRMVVYAFSYNNKTEIFYAIFTESMGRYDLFEYMLITDSHASIQQVKVLKYRSEHGGEIASKKWLAQFEHNSGEALQYGNDISAISGASISAKSITKDIPEVIQVLKSKLKL